MQLIELESRESRNRKLHWSGHTLRKPRTSITWHALKWNQRGKDQIARGGEVCKQRYRREDTSCAN